MCLEVLWFENYKYLEVIAHKGLYYDCTNVQYCQVKVKTDEILATSNCAQETITRYEQESFLGANYMRVPITWPDEAILRPRQPVTGSNLLIFNICTVYTAHNAPV